MTLKRIGKNLFFFSKIGEFPMDPVTATQNALAAFFNFLSTPAGQTAVDEFIKLDAAFIAKLKDLFDKIHSQVSGSSAPTPAKPTILGQ